MGCDLVRRVLSLSLARSGGREEEDPGNEVVWLAERSEPCSPEFISLAEIIMREDGLIMPKLSK